MTTRAKAPDWTDVMAGLTGLRLAIYDELLTSGSLDVNELAPHLRPEQRVFEQITEALAWLTTHRMVRGNNGVWTANGLDRAQTLFAEHGPVPVPGYTYNGGGSLAAMKGAVTNRSQGDTTARAEAAAVVSTPARQPVHASVFLDFGPDFS